MLSSVLQSLKERGCNVFLALPDTSVPKDLTISVSQRVGNFALLELPGHTEIRVWICPNLFEKKAYFEVYAEDYEEDYEYPKDIEEAYEEDKEESFCQGSLDIPKAISFSMDSKSGDGKTDIFWDVKDYPLPADLDSSSFYENIKSFLEEKGYLGDLLIWAYVSDDLLLLSKYRDLDNRFTLVPKVPGDKYARLNKMTVDFLLWAMDNHVQYGHSPNLMVISKTMKQETKFYPILRGLKSRGYIVLLTLPDAAKEENDIVTSVLLWKSLLSRGNPNKRKSPMS